MTKIIGILGGMGPEATADLFVDIINATPVEKDQDHFRVIIDSNPKIPDRTAHILGHGEDPLPEMYNTAMNLEKAGADVIAIPCMTAHYYRENLQKKISIPIVNAYELLNQWIKNNYPEVKKVGVLATTGSRKTKQFEKALTDYEVVFPSDNVQENCVMKAIYGKEGIKAGYRQGMPKKLIVEASDYLIEQGCELIVAGCTEIILGVKATDIDVPLADPMKIMAEYLTQNN